MELTLQSRKHQAHIHLPDPCCCKINFFFSVEINKMINTITLTHTYLYVLILLYAAHISGEYGSVAAPSHQNCNT